MNNQVYSFDVYDTCIIRNLARPIDLFYNLGFKIYAQKELVNNHEKLVEIAKFRINAEQKGRSFWPNREDITIEKFYRYFDKLHQWNLNLEDMLQAELELEYQSIRPILNTKIKINKLRENNGKIIFVSDMYLPTYFIQKMLIENGLALQEDSIYVSGDVGLTKATGELFKYVLEKECLQPHQLHHYGDNLYTDVIVPRKIGIQSSHFKDSQLNHYERRIIIQSCALPHIKSQMAGVSRAVRLMCAEETSAFRDLSSLAANIIAPLLTSYVAWVIQDAKKNGIEKLYFVSRDGQILWKIAQKLAQYMPTPECCYLYGSRQAWFLPSISSVSRESLDWLILPGHSNAPRHLLKKLGIEPVEIETTLNKYHFDRQSLDKQLDAEGVERFWQVVESPNVTSLILQKAEVAREVALRYFEQEGLCSSSKWAFVDIGWTLKCQRSLKRILNQSGDNYKVKGYYLGVMHNCLTTAEAGDYRAFLIQEANPSQYPSPTEYIFRNQKLIEQVFTIADHPTVIGYEDKDNKIYPILKAQKFSSERTSFVSSLHDVILRYADEIAKTGLLKSQIDELKRCSVSNTVEFLSKPSVQYVQPLAWLQTGDDQNESRLCPVARRITVRDLFYFAARLTHFTGSRDFAKGFSWLEGSVAISNPLVKLLFWLFTSLKELVATHKPVWVYQIWFQITKRT